jgi:vancomycin resistance protein YoaR
MAPVTEDASPPGGDDAAASSRRGRRLGAALGLGAVLLAGGYATTVWAVSSSDVPEGTTVRGVDIGGLSTDEAAARLEAELGDEASAPIPVTAGEASTELDPAESGLAVDWAATAGQATGLVLRPSALLAHLRGEVAIEPVTTVDEPALTAALADLAEVAAREPEDPTIRYTRKAVVRFEPGVPGQALDVPAAADQVAAAYLQVPTATVALPIQQVPPAVSDEEARRVVTELAEPAVAAPVTLEVTRRGKDADAPDVVIDTVTIDPVDIARAMTFATAGSTIEGTLDAEVLDERLADALAGIERPGRDARIVIEGGRPVVVPSKSGRAVDPEALASAVRPVLTERTSVARTAQVRLTVSDPDFTTAEAKALRIREKLSSFRQWFPPAAYRYQNVGQAAEYLNGTILEPGETFSMNDTIKERTPANGYTKGFIISGGRFREELGGGVSIITTATWTAGFYAGLERVEQHPHGLYISRYKAGLEATVAWGLLDLRMRNETGNGVLITAQRFSDGVLIEMWGTKKFDEVTAAFSPRTNFTGYQTITDDSDRCVPSEGVQGFSISVTRRRIIDDRVVSTETWPTRYKPTPNVVCTSPNASPG